MTGDAFLGGALGCLGVGAPLDSRSIIQTEGREGRRREIRNVRKGRRREARGEGRHASKSAYQAAVVPGTITPRKALTAEYV